MPPCRSRLTDELLAWGQYCPEKPKSFYFTVLSGRQLRSPTCPFPIEGWHAKSGAKEVHVFNDLIVSGKSHKARKPWTVAVSAAIQFAIIGALVLVPLIYTEALPKTMLSTFLVAPPPPAPPPPPAAIEKRVQLKQVINLHEMVAPTMVPKTIAIVKDETPAVDVSSGDGIAGGTGNVLGGIIGNGPSIPPPPKAPAPERIVVGGNVQSARLIDKVPPQYPQVALAARITGTVTLRAIISKDGSIEKLQLVSGPPLLAAAAFQAVKQWRYNPTMLNGQPVEVDTTIDVVFSLA
jgi:periplasmic protein TonB